MWEVVGTETGSESGREEKRDYLVPEDSQETAIPVSLWVSAYDRQSGGCRVRLERDGCIPSGSR